MKQKHMLSLLQTGFVTVNVAFGSVELQATAQPARPWDDTDKRKSATPRTYTYKAAQGLLQPNDLVLVESSGSLFGLEFARVVSVDPVPRIDVDADFDYKWIVQKVDRTEYDKRLDDERKFNDTMMEVERMHQREQALSKLSEHLPVGSHARFLFDDAVRTYANAPQIGAQVQMSAQATASDTPGFTDLKTHTENLGMQCK